MILAMLVVSIVPFGLFLATTFKDTRERIRTDTELLMSQTAAGLGRHVDEWIDKNVRMLKLAAQLEDVTSMDGARQEKVMRAIHAQYPYIYLAFTLDAQGMNMARNDGKKLKNYSDRAYYKGVAGGKALSWQTLIGKTSKKPALVLAVPIKHGTETVGVMAAAMTTDAISKQVANWKKGKPGLLSSWMKPAKWLPTRYANTSPRRLILTQTRSLPHSGAIPANSPLPSPTARG